MPWAKFLFNRYTAGILVIIVAAFVLQDLYDDAYDRGVADERARQLTALTQAAHSMRRRHEAELKSRGWQDTKEAAADQMERQKLRRRIEELVNLPPKVLVQTKVVKDASGCNCPTVTLSPDFWMRYRAAGASGGEDDPAATSAVPGEM